MFLFLSVKEKPSGTPASFRRRLASLRDVSMFLPNPASLVSSASGVANSEPGRNSPPTYFISEILERALEPSHRSMARVSARLTRGSLKGFFSLLIATVRLQIQELS